MLTCAVLGATGYTGIELVKILLRHPGAKITALSTRQKENIPLRKLIPVLPRSLDLEVKRWSFSEIRRAAELIFLCLPHTEAMQTAEAFRKAGKIVIDLSADLRLKDWRLYEAWYQVRHTNRGLLKTAVYGLPELFRSKIRKADVIANPGCYPTAAILGIAPLLKDGLIEPDSINIDAKSGVSGAGRKLTPATQFCEVDQNFSAYKVGRHQHTPEIEQALSFAAGRKVNVVFVPHLLPVERGILATIYMKPKKGVRAPAIAQAFKKAYSDEPFVRLRPEGEFPALKDVQRTNFCDIGFGVEPKTGRLIVVSVIDNLLKGASGQAVQNMNIRMGFQEEEGLRAW